MNDDVQSQQLLYVMRAMPSCTTAEDPKGIQHLHFEKVGNSYTSSSTQLSHGHGSFRFKNVATAVYLTASCTQGMAAALQAFSWPLGKPSF